MPTPPDDPDRPDVVRADAHAADDPEDVQFDHDALMALAGRIADGTTLEPSTGADDVPAGVDRDVVRALLDIAAIEAAHRQAEASFEQLWTGTSHMARQWGPLTILERIGRGEFGDVYRAHHHGLNLDVALKLAPATTDAEAARLLDEARRLARVRHTNVVRIHGVEHRDGQVGFWMDLVEGTTLDELTQAHGFSAEDAAQAGIALSRALAAVHQIGVLHGDIKAQNVVRSSSSDSPGRLVLIDFGAGRDLADRPTAGSDTIGTPVYMAPEVIDGAGRSTASDIYSLGILLFYLVARQFPIYATTKAAFRAAHANGSGLRLRDLRPDLPHPFIDIVERATANRPEARYASAGALEAALVAFLARVPVPAPLPAPAELNPPGPAPLAGRWARRAAAIAAVVIVAAVTAWRSDSNPGTPPAVAAEPSMSDTFLPIDGYTIDAAFYRATASGDERLTHESTVAVDDRLHARITASDPAYIYVVNEDERGKSFLLFPPRNGKTSNLIDARRSLRIPEDYDWSVDSAGGREHFIVFASREPVPALETALRKLASPRSPLPEGLPEQLRGVGGIVRIEQAPTSTFNAHFADLFTEPLLDRKETAKGLWARQLTVASVAR